QVAAHEEIVSPEELHRLCRIAREIMAPPHAVGRVIARPFTGAPGAFRRTAKRKDFSLPPPESTVLRQVRERGYCVVAVGKVGDILAHQDIDEEIVAVGNDAVMKEVTELAANRPGPLVVLANLVDFDTLYGHRNDANGMARALERFDCQLASLLDRLRPRGNDLLIITADHGCDPTTPSTDHSREYVPVLAMFGEGRGCDLGTRDSFADVAATICEAVGAEPPSAGESFWPVVADG
ncbi:MAG: phosphopentomutase, partial [Armatimonadetes bacterium]|nr:phosphopentomutase [Armatimonadota bacterium]